MVEIGWLPSGRLTARLNGLWLPAAGLTSPASRLGVNGRAASVAAQAEPLGPELMSKESLSWVGLFGRDQELSSAVAVFVPHVVGVASGRAGPALELQSELRERQLRRVVDRRRDLAGGRVGGDLAGQLDGHAAALGDE